MEKDGHRSSKRRWSRSPTGRSGSRRRRSRSSSPKDRGRRHDERRGTKDRDLVDHHGERKRQTRHGEGDHERETKRKRTDHNEAERRTRGYEEMGSRHREDQKEAPVEAKQDDTRDRTAGEGDTTERWNRAWDDLLFSPRDLYPKGSKAYHDFRGAVSLSPRMLFLQCFSPLFYFKIICI